MDAFDRAAARARLDLRRHLWTLATVASVTPSLGFLGTTIGMIHGFPGCGAQKSACMAATVAAQSEALLSTAAGLLVALPAVWAYHYFTQRYAELSLELDLIRPWFPLTNRPSALRRPRHRPSPSTVPSPPCSGSATPRQ